MLSALRWLGAGESLAGNIALSAMLSALRCRKDELISRHLVWFAFDAHLLPDVTP